MGALYVECSSKEMKGVDEVFELAVHTAVSAEERQWDGDNSGGRSGQGFGGKRKIRKRNCKLL